MDYFFGNKHQASKLTGLAPSTLKKYRLTGKLSQGSDWHRVNLRVVRYNLTLLEDFIRNIEKPELHQRAIEAYLAKSYQGRKPR